MANVDDEIVIIEFSYKLTMMTMILKYVCD
jgi:hypothetical protein